MADIDDIMDDIAKELADPNSALNAEMQGRTPENFNQQEELDKIGRELDAMRNAPQAPNPNAPALYENVPVAQAPVAYSLNVGRMSLGAPTVPAQQSMTGQSFNTMDEAIRSAPAPMTREQQEIAAMMEEEATIATRQAFVDEPPAAAERAAKAAIAAGLSPAQVNQAAQNAAKTAIVNALNQIGVTLTPDEINSYVGPTAATAVQNAQQEAIQQSFNVMDEAIRSAETQPGFDNTMNSTAGSSGAGFDNTMNSTAGSSGAGFDNTMNSTAGSFGAGFDNTMNSTAGSSGAGFDNTMNSTAGSFGAGFDNTMNSAAGSVAAPGLAPSNVGNFAAPGLAPSNVGNFAAPGLAPSNVGNFAAPGLAPSNVGNFAAPGLAGFTQTPGLTLGTMPADVPGFTSPNAPQISAVTPVSPAASFFSAPEPVAPDATFVGPGMTVSGVQSSVPGISISPIGMPGAYAGYDDTMNSSAGSFSGTPDPPSQNAQSLISTEFGSGVYGLDPDTPDPNPPVPTMNPRSAAAVQQNQINAMVDLENKLAKAYGLEVAAPFSTPAPTSSRSSRGTSSRSSRGGSSKGAAKSTGTRTVATWGPEGQVTFSQEAAAPSDPSRCYIATDAVSSGAFSKLDKAKAELWCKRALHNHWAGETVRLGYQALSKRAVANGTASKHYDEFQRFVRYGRGLDKTLKGAVTFYTRMAQFFAVGVINRLKAR